MRVARLIIQLVFVFAISGVMFYWFGPNYWIVALIAAALASLLLMNSRARRLEVETREIGFGEHANATFWIIVIGLVLGVFWPSVPIIVGVGKLRENGAGGAPGTKERQPTPLS